MLILDSESPISATDENSKISLLICDDNNLPPVNETVAVTPDERDERVASPCEIRKPEIALSEEDISPYGQTVPCVAEDLLSGQPLGTGASGEVFECIDKNTNRHMAYKVRTCRSYYYYVFLFSHSTF